MMVGLLLFLFIVILVPSSLLGAYTTVLYIIIGKFPERLSLTIPLLLTILLPVAFSCLTRNVGNVSVELLPILGYSALFLVVTAMATAPLIPLTLLRKFRKIDRAELVVFVASTISFAFVFLQGFAEVMGASRTADTSWISTLSEIYVKCLKIALVSFIVYLAFLTIQKNPKGDNNEEK